jgi:hypothetical protein
MKIRRFFPLLAIFSILLSGFTIRPPASKADDLSMSIFYTTTVQSDGSGDVEVEFIYSKDLVDLMRSESNNLDCHSVMSPTKLDFSDKSQGGNLDCVGTAAFNNLAELVDLTQNELGVSVNRIEIREKHFYYDVSMNMVWGSTGDLKMEELWILVLPGIPGDNNADTVSGRTLTWNLFTRSGSFHLTAECAIGGDGSLGKATTAIATTTIHTTTIATTTMKIAAAVMMSCCCVILLIAAVVVFFLMRRKNKQPAAENPSAGTIIPGR